MVKRAIKVILCFFVFLFVVFAVVIVYFRWSANNADKNRIGDSRPSQNTIILISIDGLRGDAIKHANAKNLISLMNRGSYTLEAQTVSPSWTVPAHVSLGTGLTPEKHGILSNGDILRAYVDNQSGKLATILDFAKASGLSTAAVVGKTSKSFRGHSFLSIRNLDQLIEVDGGAAQIAGAAIQVINKQELSFVFVYFPEVDFAGHEFGWLSSQQIEAIQRVDYAVGLIINSLGESLRSGDTYLFITSDHGGHDRNHGTDLPEDMTIPWIIVGPNVRRNHKITGLVYGESRRTISICDTPATIVHILGAKAPSDWDGKSVSEVFFPD